MSSKMLIWGGGGHGKVVADLIRLCGLEVAGFVDRDASKRDLVVEPGGARVIMAQHELERLLEAHGGLPANASYVALGIGKNRIRLECAKRLDDLLAPSLVHPRAAVSPFAAIGAGSVVFAGAVVNSDARVGDAVIINSGAVVEHDCVVDDGAHVSPNATLTGGVSVGECAWIGARAVVLPGLHVGQGAIVGAGAVVTRDVPSHTTVVGNPARVLEGMTAEST